MQTINNPWELVTDDPLEQQYLDLKSKLLIMCVSKIRRDFAVASWADGLGLSKKTVANVVEGRLSRIEIDTLVKLALKLGLTVAPVILRDEDTELNILNIAIE